MKKYIGFSVAVCMGLASCKQASNEAPTLPVSANAASAASSPNVTKEEPSTDINTPNEYSFVEIQMDPSTTEAMNIANGQTVTANFIGPQNGSVQGVQILVGNYNNSSVGDVRGKFCADANCGEGHVSLSQAHDNQYLFVKLDKLIEIQKDAKLSFTLTRSSGDNNFAIYVYPSGPAGGSMVGPDGKVSQKIPRIRLGFNR